MRRRHLGVAATLILASTVVACVTNTPIASTGVAPTVSAVVTSPSSTPSPDPSPAPSGMTVSEALARRDAGQLGSEQITLVGYWSNRVVGHSCAPAPQPQAELELWCHADEYGITERNEPVAEWIPPNRLIATDGPRLTPWLSEAVTARLFDTPVLGDVFFPPVPIVVLGHFDDPRAADCRVEARQACRERFVIDEVVSFDPSSVPLPTPTPSPTPFPSPAPAALFSPDRCAGDVDYSFVGWATMDELHVDPLYGGHVFAMVTAEVIPATSWANDPAGSGQKFRWWAQQVCYSEDYYIGEEFNVVPMGFAWVIGTAFKEWEDGRREASPSP